MVADQNLNRQILSLIPHRPPFRFIDAVLDADHQSITGVYRFRENEFFYSGHFPEKPITPGVILIEAMAQTGVVGLGISRLLFQGRSPEEIQNMTTLFTFAENVEFSGMVFPGETVHIQGEMVYFRRKNLKTRVVMKRENGRDVCTAILSGAGVNINGN
ncbi:MAG: beta-hydroxyacyl-ACP dehydratase [Desulfobacteraceae bacterium]|nr:MAG: beta-hydroxyacyl-ACP dehydratase [Desulfobacteraceae bacterium]